MEHTEWQQYIAKKGQAGLRRKLGSKEATKEYMRRLAIKMHQKRGHKLLVDKLLDMRPSRK